jgi:hypothetical protein
MKQFHILYYKEKGNHYANGINIDAENFFDAVVKFTEKYNIQPFSVTEKKDYLSNPVKICTECKELKMSL